MRVGFPESSDLDHDHHNHTNVDKTTTSSSSGTAYPLKVSANGRYPVDQKGTPFLIAGESPQALMVNLTEKDAELFFANRRSHGFNTSTVTVLPIGFATARRELALGGVPVVDAGLLVAV